MTDLQVKVHNFLLVTVVESREQLGHVESCFFLIQIVLLRDILKQLSTIEAARNAGGNMYRGNM